MNARGKVLARVNLCCLRRSKVLRGSRERSRRRMEAESAWRKRWNAACGEREVEKQAVTGLVSARMADMVCVAGMSALPSVCLLLSSAVYGAYVWPARESQKQEP